MAMAFVIPGMWEWPRAMCSAGQQAFERRRPTALRRGIKSECPASWSGTAPGRRPSTVAPSESKPPSKSSLPTTALLDRAGWPPRSPVRTRPVHLLRRHPLRLWIADHACRRRMADATSSSCRTAAVPAWGWRIFPGHGDAAGVQRVPRRPAFARRGSEEGRWLVRRTWILRAGQIAAGASGSRPRLSTCWTPTCASPEPDTRALRALRLPSPCLAMNQGADVEAILHHGYQLRRKADRGGRLGGGSWSMHRAPPPPPQWRSPPG